LALTDFDGIETQPIFLKTLTDIFAESRTNSAILLDQSFLTEHLLEDNYPVYTIKVWSKFDQSFYPKLPFGGKF
jgi:hypothetical protein